MSLIECVPNISEGRRPDIIAELADIVRQVSPVHLLDASSDADHNRSVLTFAGDAHSLRRAVVALFEAALTRLDLRGHRGVHPRIGIVDVVPFVPLGQATMEACVRLAHATGEEVSRRFDIPVYCYEEAAAVPWRRRLEDIRRGQFEGLAERMQQPGWAPDYGPSRPHPTAGATAFGARRPLVAYNINLGTGDVRIARHIAARIRERGGGLPFVKALGVPLPARGLVQVSMNLTNVEVTPIPAVFQAVSREAAAQGVGIIEAELIGLAPEAAFGSVSPASVGLHHFDGHQVLERRIAALDTGLP